MRRFGHRLPRLTFALVVVAFLATPGLARSAQEPRVSAAVPPPDVAAPPSDAETTPSGLASRVISAGTGTGRPGPQDIVTVHYTGWTADGRLFDSSVLRGTPSTFPLDRVIAGWSEGVQLMVVGEKRRLWVPEALAYQGDPDRPQGMLVFDVELLDIEDPLAAPADVAAPPADAERTRSGLMSKILRPGTGQRHPIRTSTVAVHYSGWTSDGELFDSSVARGAPATFRLDEVIAGWTEGVQLMVEGEKRRFWIPERLAYGGQAGAPRGMLVFDVELLSIER
jgi:FKBP-type peptidyl-prolyl cis-trans isomerase